MQPMAVHAVFDVAAWLSAWAIGRWVSQRYFAGGLRTPFSDPLYFIALGIGAIAGALVFGSLNMTLAGLWQIGHSIAGAIAGGVVGVELYKRIAGIKGSTGGQFVASLALGIAVGRLGCFFAGLPDFTYGTATALPWGVDFGDGIARHPVQLYESAAMLAFLAAYLYALTRGSEAVRSSGFYLFTGWYAAQRFAWEFLKPYPPVLGPLNVFHLICIALLAYSIWMMRQTHELRAAV
ncbi:MAG: prolipoprotein diacylglyceryl transferase [Proteobacteria bacterium]|nr:prolipoprotein diacylglyceryl transferase [Pseudomonadota bacterium]